MVWTWTVFYVARNLVFGSAYYYGLCCDHFLYCIHVYANVYNAMLLILIFFPVENKVFLALSFTERCTLFDTLPHSLDDPSFHINNNFLFFITTYKCSPHDSIAYTFFCSFSTVYPWYKIHLVVGNCFTY